MRKRCSIFYIAGNNVIPTIFRIIVTVFRNLSMNQAKRAKFPPTLNNNINAIKNSINYRRLEPVKFFKVNLTFNFKNSNLSSFVSLPSNINFRRLCA